MEMFLKMQCSIGNSRSIDPYSGTMPGEVDHWLRRPGSCRRR